MIQRKTPPAAKKPSWLQRWQDGWFGPMLRTPIAIFNQFWEKANHFARTNYEIGCEQIERGNLNDAIFRFKIVTWAEPNHYLSWYNMGCCYLSKGELAKAMVALRRALTINPKSVEARFMLFTIDSKALPRDQMPATMPAEMILNQFGGDVSMYDEMQTQALGYRLHINLRDAIQKELEANRIDYAMLDLGCGTGMCGALLRPSAKLMIGVDLSPSMAQHAAEIRDANGHKVYDDVQVVDIAAFLAKVTEPSYDVIFACNSLNFVGDLTAVFDGVTRGLKSRGLFAFTTDIPDVNSGYQVVPGLARFGHSEEYLKQQAARCGLVEAGIHRPIAYRDFPMLQCLFRKP